MSDSVRPYDYSPPSSSVHGILQARRMEWVCQGLQEIFPTQRSNLCLSSLLHWQAGSSPLDNLEAYLLKQTVALTLMYSCRSCLSWHVLTVQMELNCASKAAAQVYTADGFKGHWQQGILLQPSHEAAAECRQGLPNLYMRQGCCLLYDGCEIKDVSLCALMCSKFSLLYSFKEYLKALKRE